MAENNVHNDFIFDKKFKALVDKYQDLKKEKSVLCKNIDDAQNQLKIAHKENVDLQEEYRNFRLSEYLSAQGDGAVKAEFRHTIEGLVRKIDTCLKLLKG